MSLFPTAPACFSPCSCRSSFLPAHTPLRSRHTRSAAEVASWQVRTAHPFFRTLLGRHQPGWRSMSAWVEADLGLPVGRHQPGWRPRSAWVEVEVGLPVGRPRPGWRPRARHDRGMPEGRVGPQGHPLPGPSPHRAPRPRVPEGAHRDPQAGRGNRHPPVERQREEAPGALARPHVSTDEKPERTIARSEEKDRQVITRSEGTIRIETREP
jgi:hypothetical protein